LNWPLGGEVKSISFMPGYCFTDQYSPDIHSTELVIRYPASKSATEVGISVMVKEQKYSAQ